MWTKRDHSVLLKKISILERERERERERYDAGHNYGHMYNVEHIELLKENEMNWISKRNAETIVQLGNRSELHQRSTYLNYGRFLLLLWIIWNDAATMFFRYLDFRCNDKSCSIIRVKHLALIYIVITIILALFIESTSSVYEDFYVFTFHAVPPIIQSIYKNQHTK